MCSLLNESQLVPETTRYTRVTPASKTLIDFILYCFSEAHDDCSTAVKTCLNDHYLVKTIIKSTFEQSPETITFKYFKYLLNILIKHHLSVMWNL